MKTRGNKSIKQQNFIFCFQLRLTFSYCSRLRKNQKRASQDANLFQTPAPTTTKKQRKRSLEEEPPKFSAEDAVKVTKAEEV